MTRLVFEEFDHFAEAINGIAGRFVPTARAQAEWWVQVVPVGRLSLQQVQIGGPSTFAGDGADDAITLGIPITAPQRVRIDGETLGHRSLIAVREGQPFTFSARQSTRWAGVTIPIEGLLAPEVVDALYFNKADPSATHTFSTPAYVAAMRSMIVRTCASENIDALRGRALDALQEEITLLASRLLQTNQAGTSACLGRPRYDRDRVIARVIELLEATKGQPLLLQDLCKASRVCERTLRMIFHEYFGVGPMRLLKLRQLHEVRCALATADAKWSSVKDVLARFGVFDLTVFARNYKALYGELPSQTLRRPPHLPSHEIGSATWLNYMSRRFYATSSEARPQGSTDGHLHAVA